jgi:replicative DNA helicase
MSPFGDATVEMAVIGAALCDQADASLITGVVRVDDFTTERSRRIFSEIVNLVQQGEDVNSVQVGFSLRDRGILGHDDLSFLTDCRQEWVPGTCDVTRHVDRLKDASLRRRLFAFGNSIALKAETDPGSARTLLVAAECELRGFDSYEHRGLGQTGAELIAAGGGLDNFLQVEPGLLTGLRTLDMKTGGIAKGDLVILAARPSVGKTALALQVAGRAAATGSILFASLEMEPRSLLRRCIAARARVSYNAIRLGFLNAAEVARVNSAANEISKLPITYTNSRVQTLLELRAAIRTLASKSTIALVAIDYLQLLRTPGARRDNRNIEVSDLSRGLKLMATEFKVPFLVLSQLNRAPAKECREPQLSDLRDSGSIEQDADGVWLLHRNQAKQERAAKLIIGKQRNGECGRISLEFEPRFGTFREVDGSEVPA